MQKLLCILTSMLIAGTTQGSCFAERPNVVVIMADDLGYSDLGCYGSEIETPNLDSLAANGLRFSQFYNTAKCHSSRVSLLTGQYCIAAGDTALSNAITSAEVLGAAGYFTAMTGKWHLKKTPRDFGFKRYFGHLSGACNYFRGDKTFRLNDDSWNVPDRGFYTTVANVDFALKFLNEARQTKQPWYLYVAFNAPHAPLHALPEDYKKYAGRYDQGWDKIRERRVKKQKSLGLLPQELRASDRPEHIPAWNSLDSWRQDYEANRMQTLAAMIDRLDQEIGRLIKNLQASGEFENTLILFVSDNGACPYDRRKPVSGLVPTNADNAFPDSTGWSWVRNSPFRYYKQNQFEGGISTPAIVHWPAGLKTSPGSICEFPAHLIDVLPTLAAVTQSKIPTQAPERELHAVSGISLMPIFNAENISDRPPLHFQFQLDRGLRFGDWKLVSFRGKTWELYNLSTDRAETRNLAATEKERLKQMISTWRSIGKHEARLPANLMRPASKDSMPHRHQEWTDFDSAPDGKSDRKVTTPKPIPIGRIRPSARKNTTLKIRAGIIEMKMTGEDPGLRLDLRNCNLAEGPYKLSFDIRCYNTKQVEIFYTTSRQTQLPKGTKIEASITPELSDWQGIRLELGTVQRLYQLRIDPSEGPGKASIKNLRLENLEGQVLAEW